MWTFNEVGHDNYLAHASGHKYIEREWKNGRWVYTYDDKTNDRFQTGAKPVLLRNRYNQKRLGTLNKLKGAKYRADTIATANIANDNFKIAKDTKKVMKKGSNSRRAALRNYSYRINANVNNLLKDRRSSELASKERTRLVREGQAEIASAKSKKSLKRKAKKTYYKTRDAVRSIPSAINTNKGYKSGNRTVASGERGPLISTNNTRKNRKKKRG